MNVFKKISNILSYLLFRLLRLIFYRQSTGETGNILFLNTGQIGDLVVSSMIFDNDDAFKSESNVYFLMKQEYFSLFNNYKGKVNILTYNYNKYKFSIFYRIKLLKKLNFQVGKVDF